jgi:hypothetical protein
MYCKTTAYNVNHILTLIIDPSELSTTTIVYSFSLCCAVWCCVVAVVGVKGKREGERREMKRVNVKA